MAEHGEYSGHFHLRIPKSLHRKAALCASRDGVSLNQWLVAAIAQYVGAHPEHDTLDELVSGLVIRAHEVKSS